MAVLNKKVYRELYTMKAQIFTISLVIACGIAVLLSSLTTHESLKKAQSSFYQQNNFSNFFASVQRAPLHVLGQILEIPGVLGAEGRIVHQASLDFPAVKEPVSAKFVSISRGQRQNLLFLKKGRLPDFIHPNEIVVSEAFAKARKLILGDQVRALFNGRMATLQIVGIAVSPEYIYTIRPGSPMPDDLHFGIFWISYEALSAFLDMREMMNDIVLSTHPELNQKVLKPIVEDLTKPYGALASYGRDKQMSHYFISDEINQQKVMAIFLPTIFLLVSAFLLNVVMNRFIATQREQVATLKSLGVSDWKISLHYFYYVLIIVFIGSILGLALGYYAGSWMTDLYLDFFHFPILSFVFDYQWILFSIIATFMSAFLGALRALNSVFALTPAVAMLPQAPRRVFQLHFENSKYLSWLKAPMRFFLRNLLSHPLKSFLVFISLGLAQAVLVVSFFWQDAVDYIMKVQFNLVQREDAQVIFSQPVGQDAVSEIQKLEGVLEVEAYRYFAIKVTLGHKVEDTSLLALPDKTQLRKNYDKKLKEISIPKSGLALSQQLAKKLGVKLGDKVRVEIREVTQKEANKEFEFNIEAIVDDFIGSQFYVNLEYINQLLSEPKHYSVLSMIVDTKYSESIYNHLKVLPKVTSVVIKESALRTFNETSAKFILTFAFILFSFALVISVGVIYNNARVLLSERSIDYGSLRVLGFYQSEVFKLIFGDLILLIVLSLPLGAGLGALLGLWSIQMIHNEAIQIPFVIYPRTFVYGVLAIVGAAVISLYWMSRKVKEIDLVKILKVRE